MGRLGSKVITTDDSLGTTVDDAITAAGLASTADVATAVSGLATTAALTAVEDALKAGAGYPFTLKNDITGGGVETYHDLTKPSAITLTDGHKYRINGTIQCRVTASPYNKVCQIVVKDVIVKYTASGTVLAVVSPGTQVQESGDADGGGYLFADYYASGANIPELGLSNGAGATGDQSLAVVHTPVNAAAMTVEWDGTWADIGVN